MSIENRQSKIANRPWLDLITTHPQATIFHHPAWIDVLARCYGFRAEILGVPSSSDRLAAGLPLMEMDGWPRGRRLAALPFSDHCAPLARDGKSLDALIDMLELYRRERGIARLEIHWPIAGRGYQTAEFHLHRTELPVASDELFSRFHRTRVQQPIRAAARAGVKVRRASTMEDLRIFYRMHLVTRARLGAPVQPYRFFRLLWEHLILRDLGFILFAELEGRPIATALVLTWNGVLTYKFAASDPASWDHAPNHALLWEAMQWGVEKKFRTFDWGRTDIGHESLREFKCAWDAGEERLTYTVLSDSPPGAGISPLAGRFTAGFIRRSPPWVCRIIGELFYGKFG